MRERDIARLIALAIRSWAGTWSAVALVGLSAAGMAREEGRSVNPARNPAPASPIALLDVKYVLEHDATFRRRKDEFDAGAALAEAAIRQRKDEIRGLSQRLRGLQAGSAEHTELDLEILRRTAELRSQVERARKKLAAEEAQVYVNAYREIVRAVDRYLDETDYRLVLRVNTSDVEIGAAGEFHDEAALQRKQSIPRTVVFAQGGVDITREILRRLDEDRQKSAGHVDESLRDSSSRLGETRPRVLAGRMRKPPRR